VCTIVSYNAHLFFSILYLPPDIFYLLNTVDKFISGLLLNEHLTNGDQWSDRCGDINDFDMAVMFSPQG
jgi:hypothetical protein